MNAYMEFQYLPSANSLALTADGKDFVKYNNITAKWDKRMYDAYVFPDELNFVADKPSMSSTARGLNDGWTVDLSKHGYNDYTSLEWHYFTKAISAG